MIHSYVCAEGHYHNGTGQDGQTCPDKLRSLRRELNSREMRRARAAYRMVTR